MLIKNTKTNYYKSKINENKNNSKKLWKCVKDICNHNSVKNKYITEINLENGSTTKDKKEIANRFNRHYVQHGRELANKIKINEPIIDNAQHLPNSIYLLPTNPLEIKSTIMELKLGKAPGNDGITSEVLKNISDFIITPLAYLVNLIIYNGDCPELFKMGIVKPIYKANDKLEVINYRPITLISNIRKNI